MAITEDASTPAVTTASSPGPVTSPAFTPPDASLVHVIVVAGWGTGTSVALTDSGSHTWTSVISRNTSGGLAKILECYFVTSPGSITLTATYTSNNDGCLLAPRVLMGANASQAGRATATKGWSTTDGEISITTTTTGSVVYGASNESGGAGATFTADAASVRIGQLVDGVDLTTSVAWKSLNATGTPGATTLGGTYSATGAGNSVAAEVLPAAAAASLSPPPPSLLVARLLPYYG